MRRKSDPDVTLSRVRGARGPDDGAPPDRVRRGLVAAAGLGVLLPGAGSRAAIVSEPQVGTVNVRDFGAKADGVSDDAAAINAAIMSIRQSPRHPSVRYPSARLWFPTGVYVVKSTIDLTMLDHIGVLVDGAGSQILGRCGDQVVLDGLGSRWLTIRDLLIHGDEGQPPTVGVQIGRDADFVVADDHLFENVRISGQFSLACLLNQAAETTIFTHVLLWNDFPSANSYCLIQDGLGHFAARARTISSQSHSVDRDDSFNENVFVSCDFRHMGGGVPVWLGDTSRHSFIRCYAAGIGVAAFEVYAASNGNTILDIDCHCETTRLAHAVMFTGTNLNPILRGFSFRDHRAFCGQSVFAAGDNINVVNLQHADIEIAGFQNPACQLFDDYRRFKATGDIYLSSDAHWNPASAFKGRLQLGDEIFNHV